MNAQLIVKAAESRGHKLTPVRNGKAFCTNCMARLQIVDGSVVDNSITWVCTYSKTSGSKMPLGLKLVELILSR